MATGRQSEQEEERLVMEGLVAEMELRRCRMPEEGLGTAQAGAPRLHAVAAAAEAAAAGAAEAAAVQALPPDASFSP